MHEKLRETSTAESGRIEVLVTLKSAIVIVALFDTRFTGSSITSVHIGAPTRQRKKR